MSSVVSFRLSFGRRLNSSWQSCDSLLLLVFTCPCFYLDSDNPFSFFPLCASSFCTYAFLHLPWLLNADSEVYTEGGPAPLLADISTQPCRRRTLRQMRVSPERQVYSLDFVRKKYFLIIKLRIFAPLLTSWPISLLLSTESTNLVGPIPWSRTDDSCSISE